MDSKLNVDSRLADLDLKTTVITAVVGDIPGSSIVTDNVVLDMTKFAPTGEAEVISCELMLVGVGTNETGAITNAGDVYTANFTAAATVASIVRVTVKRTI